MFSDKVTIKTDQSKGIFINSFSDICDSEHEFFKDYKLNNFILIGKEKETFSLQYLNYIFAPTFVNTIVSDLEISLKSNNNLRLKFKFSFGGPMTIFLEPFKDLDNTTESDQDIPIDFSLLVIPTFLNSSKYSISCFNNSWLNVP